MAGLGQLIKAASPILPEVPKPARKRSLNERLIWTALALLLYFGMSQIPLYGVSLGQVTQQEIINIIFASNMGTLMTLGIGPIVTAGLILQLLKGAEIIKLDFKKPGDRALFTSATKLLTIIVTLGEGFAFSISGLLGRSLSSPIIAIILVQLLFAGIVVMLLDELMQKGWGLGSGVSLFILAGVAQTLAWNTFSIVPTGDGLFGAIPHLITSAIGGNPWAAWIRLGTLPSLIGLILTIVVILVVVYIEGLRIEVPIRSTKYSGFAGVYPLKLLYVSNLPIILVSALLANLGFLSQFIWTQFNPGNTSPLVSLLVMYNTTDPSQGLTGGLMYYINSPQGFSNALADPLRAVTYMIFVVIAAILFARIWVEIGGLSPSAAAKSLIDADVQIPGFRRTEVSIESILARHIPVITFIGGLILGLVASVSDIMGVFGSGTGILLSVGIVMQYYQLLVREHLETMMPRLGALLGRV